MCLSACGGEDAQTLKFYMGFFPRKWLQEVIWMCMLLIRSLLLSYTAKELEESHVNI